MSRDEVLVGYLHLARLVLELGILNEAESCGEVIVVADSYLSGLVGDQASRIYPPGGFHDNKPHS